MHVRAVDFILLPVSDLDRAARFYRETLGLPQEIFSEEYQWAEFDCGNVTLALHGGQAPAVGAGVRIALAVDDVRRTCARLHAHGVKIAEGPVNYSVCRSARILDPDGNSLLLHHRADDTAGPSAPSHRLAAAQRNVDACCVR